MTRDQANNLAGDLNAARDGGAMNFFTAGEAPDGTWVVCEFLQHQAPDNSATFLRAIKSRADYR